MTSGIAGRIYKHLILIVFTFFVVCPTSGSLAQDSWDLNACIRYARSNNPVILQASLEREKNKVRHLNAKQAFLPEISANMRTGNNWGLFIDPATNILDHSYNVNTHAFLYAGLDLFNGFRNHYNIRLQAQGLSETEFAWQKALNEVALKITLQYYQILYAEELLNNAIERKKQVAIQKETVRQMVEHGTLHKRELLNMEFLVTSEERLVVDAENQKELGTFLLMQEMGIGMSEPITIEKTIEDQSQKLLSEEDLSLQIETAKNNLPDLKLIKAKMNQADYLLRLSRASRYPSLMVQGALGTRTSSFQTHILPVAEQIPKNFYQFIGINLSVPIFTKGVLQTNMRLAELDLQSSHLAYKQTNLLLEQSVTAASLALKASKKKYEASLKQIKAVSEEFKYAEKMLELGVMNTLDYGNIRSRFIQSQTVLLQDKYEFLIKQKAMEFYEGKLLDSQLQE